MLEPSGPLERACGRRHTSTSESCVARSSLLCVLAHAAWSRYIGRSSKGHLSEESRCVESNFQHLLCMIQEQNVDPLMGICYEFPIFLSPRNWIHFLINLNPAEPGIEAKGRNWLYVRWGPPSFPTSTCSSCRPRSGKSRSVPLC